MLRLFKKTRKKLLSENKITKYLVYALGEILLIVIGILIALAINNWNEGRIQSQKEEFYLLGLKNEFKQSKAKLQALLEINTANYEKARSLYLIAQDSIPDEAEIAKLVYQSLSNEMEYNPNNSLLNELLNSGALKDISNDSLRKHLTGWESRLQSVRRQERTLQSDRQKILDIIRQKGDIKSIADQTGISQQLRLPPTTPLALNAQLIRTAEFKNSLLLFILTTEITQDTHYKPLLAEINTLLRLIENRSF
ncbi:MULTISPECIES: DUF6090 family protein [unclassified Leeuwenhoekiella]|uniref:DUF6090 family protein n=1 Tax=unclassified Leeuwenhoekiella TaxID=2615029 RepID=UPI000C5BA9A2|nr:MULTISPECIES: DUF6090 family protein [unclassified Leeuwenhoekiella]MAW96563.1 hypothetical protein [Leeuwenhoekiella sp.]MBA81451.1 hypothetical protein [Leeuwenhoekiella sp.]|tara:strand:+ start:8734 stop:9489 length:756 start_codon:yes stop_codon:yes gene_type:complete